MGLTFFPACAYTNYVAYNPLTGPLDDFNVSKRFFFIRIGDVSNAAFINNGPYYYSILNLTTNTYLAQNVLFNLPVAGGGSSSVYVSPSFDTPLAPAGTYQISVFSGLNPAAVQSQTVTMVDPIVLSDVTFTVTANASCTPGVSNGTITANFTGPVPTDYFYYDVQTPNPVYIQVNGASSLVFNNLPGGTYFFGFTYRETVGCGSQNAVLVLGNGIYKYVVLPNVQGTVSIVPTSTPEVCSDGTGVIQLAVTGLGPYTFDWSGPGGFTANTQDITGLSSGTYTVVVNDSTGCTGTASVVVSNIPDQNGCVLPVTCYKVVNCDPDCFGTKVYYLTGSEIGALEGYIINGLEIDGEVIDPTACWTVEETDPSESEPGQAPACYNDLEIGVRVGLRNCIVTVNGTNIFTGNPIQINTAAFVTAIIAPGGLSNSFTATAAVSLTAFNICPPDWTYSNANVIVGYEWFDNIAKIWVGEQIGVQFGPGVPPTGCYTAKDFLGYNTVFSTCELCKPIACPEEPPFVKIIPDPVKIYYQIRESKCDITVTKQFATAYSNMLKKIKYGVADCCSGLNIAETWVNKQISNLQATVIPGYNCRTLPMDGCSWLPLQGCELLVSPTDGTSILVIAGEDMVYAKLVMLLSDGKAYLNQPLDTNNYQRAIGFTTMDVQMNHSTRVLVNGMITNPAWSLVTGAIYYAAPNGNITTIVPNTGISQAIGIAVNPTTLFVDIKQPNNLC